VYSSVILGRFNGHHKIHLKTSQELTLLLIFNEASMTYKRGFMRLRHLVDDLELKLVHERRLQLEVVSDQL